MLPTNLYSIRAAGAGDEAALRDLSQLDSQRPVSLPALIGEIDGRPAAAISLAERRIVADPFQRTAGLAAQLRIQAGAYHEFRREPSLRERIRAALQPFKAQTAR